MVRLLSWAEKIPKFISKLYIESQYNSGSL